MNEAEKLTLKQYANRSKELEKTATDFFKIQGVRLEMNPEKGSITFNEPIPDHIIKAFLVDLRHFYMQKSPIHFTSVCNLIIQRSHNQTAIEVATKARKAWHKTLSNPTVKGVAVVIEDVEYKANELFELWLNGEFFHLDAEKSKILSVLKSNPMGQMTFYYFVIMAQDLAELVFFLDQQAIRVL